MTKRARDLLKEREDAKNDYQRDLVDQRIKEKYGSEKNWLEDLGRSDVVPFAPASDVVSIPPLDVPEEDRASDLRLGLEGEDRRLGLQAVPEDRALLSGQALGPGPNQPEDRALLSGQALGPGSAQPETSDVLRGQAFGPSERIMAEAQALEQGLGMRDEPTTAAAPLVPPAAAAAPLVPPAAVVAAPVAAEPAAQVDAARLQYQRESLVPDPKEDPVGAIAFVLESISKGYAGKELPITRFKKERIAQETHELNQMTTGLDMQEKVLEQTKGLPFEQRIQAIEKFGARMERIMPGWTASAVAAAQREVETGVNSAIYPGIVKVLFAVGGDCHSTLGTGGAQACFNDIINNKDHREKAQLVYAKTQAPRINDTIRQLREKISESDLGREAIQQIEKMFEKGLPLSDFKTLLGRHIDAEDMSIIESNPKLFNLFDDSELVSTEARAMAVQRMFANVAPGLRPIVEHMLGLDTREKDQLFRLLDAISEHEKAGTTNTPEAQRLVQAYEAGLNKGQQKRTYRARLDNKGRVVTSTVGGEEEDGVRPVAEGLTPQVLEQRVSQADYLGGLVKSIDGMLARMETHPGEFGIGGALTGIAQSILAGGQEIAGLGFHLIRRRDQETEMRSHGLGSAILGSTLSEKWLEAINEFGYFNPNIPAIKVYEGTLALALAKIRLGEGDTSVRAITKALTDAKKEVNIVGATTVKSAKARLEAIRVIFADSLSALNRRLTGGEGADMNEALTEARRILQTGGN